MSRNETNVGDQFSAQVIKFEASLRDTGPDDWYDAVITVIDGLFDACMPLGLKDLGVEEHIRQHWYTRVAAGLTMFVASPAIRVNAEKLAALSRRKQQIAYIFNASGYRNTVHLLTHIGSRSDSGVSVPLDRLAVYFAFVSLDDVPPKLLDLALQQTPDVVLLLMMGWLNQRAVLTEQGERNRSRLLESGEKLLAAGVNDNVLQLMVNAWMYSTYADASHKHQIKRHINQLLRGLLSNVAVAVLPTERVVKDKPRLLVIHERFIKQHAMFRCYAPHLRRLKDHFELVALAESEHIDEASDDIFDQIFRINDKVKSIPNLVRTIETINPDMIYYPRAPCYVDVGCD